MQAVWNGEIIADSDDTVVIDGNHYFPRHSLNDEYFREGSMTTVCPWKGTASYLTITVGGKQNEGAAWFYPAPKPAAAEIRDRVAFWRGVQVR